MAGRVYTQTARAARTERTRIALLDATIAAFLRTGTLDTPLSEIAEAAGTTTRTALRQFGTKDALTAAAAERAAVRVLAQRAPVAPGAAAAVASLVEHYEEWGSPMARLTAEAATRPDLAAVIEQAVAVHDEWIRTAFAAELAEADHRTRAHRLAVLGTVCDAETWRLLRQRHGLDRESAERAMVHLVRSALEANP